jgi:hypothetical protein
MKIITKSLFLLSLLFSGNAISGEIANGKVDEVDVV